MGNICGKESADSFAKPGRTLSSAPPPSNTTTIPVPKSRKVGGKAAAVPNSEDARRQAAAAAEARAQKSSKPAGKLERDLQEQRKQTRTDTLRQASKEERAARNADSNAEILNYN